jgi:DDE superfamily endonuclease
LDYKSLTGMTKGQIAMLALLVYKEIGSLTKPGAKKPAAVGLLESIVIVVVLMRRNCTQAVAAGMFGCSQSTVSRRWDLLRPIIAKVLASYIPNPVQVIGLRGTPLVDGTICPVWDWKAIPDLYSGKAKMTGMSVQISCNLNGDVAVIAPIPVNGARHDAYAFGASGMKAILEESFGAEIPAADLGYVGVDGIGIVPFKRRSGSELEDWQREYNTDFSKARSAVEHAVGKVKRWRMLSKEGGRYRCAIDKFASVLAAITALYFFCEYESGQ